MLFALITLLSALSLAGVAGWFSIIGITSIYAGAPIHALMMGAVLEGGKLVTTSWLYRNWTNIDWSLKTPLIVFTLTLMLATSIGVFGFLSKAHLEQGAGTVDNTAKVERLDEQIAREKATIADDSKVIAQLDATINSYLGKDRADRSVIIRKKQDPQRNQLRADIDTSQKRIDAFSDEKFKLTSEVRKLQLDVGPIRYIAELVYGTDGSAEKNIESAVRMFTLIIVSTLDPLAIVLLIAANHTILRNQDEKKRLKEERSIGNEIRSDAPTDTKESTPSENLYEFGTSSLIHEILDEESGQIPVDVSILQEPVVINEEGPTSPETDSSDSKGIETTIRSEAAAASVLSRIHPEKDRTETELQGEVSVNAEELPVVPAHTQDGSTRTDVLSPAGLLESLPEGEGNNEVHSLLEITWPKIPPSQKTPTLKDYIARITQEEAISLPIIRHPVFSRVLHPHFIPQKLNEEEIARSTSVSPENGQEESTPEAETTSSDIIEEIPYEISSEIIPIEEDESLLQNSIPGLATTSYPKTLSWLREFKRITS